MMPKYWMVVSPTLLLFTLSVRTIGLEIRHTILHRAISLPPNFLATKGIMRCKLPCVLELRW